MELERFVAFPAALTCFAVLLIACCVIALFPCNKYNSLRKALILSAQSFMLQSSTLPCFTRPHTVLPLESLTCDSVDIVDDVLPRLPKERREPRGRPVSFMTLGEAVSCRPRQA